MGERDFFEESREQSAIKGRIVAKYLWAWANIVGKKGGPRVDKIAYVDLFAGPGRYKDGTPSTPIRVLEEAIEDPRLSRMLVTIFNDKDADSCAALEVEIRKLAGIENLKHRPRVLNQEVGEETVEGLGRKRFVPTLFFIDPWGYKGLSLDLVNALVKDWACECIFFFNYNRVRMGLTNLAVKEHMDGLFGQARADALRRKVVGLSSRDCEFAIVEKLCEAVNPSGKGFVLPFRFRNQRGTRTSHHLIFVSKKFLGYDIMKHIMAKESSTALQGVASLEYNPADARFPLLFDLTRRLEDLKEMLVRDFAGRRVWFKELYETHSVDKPYVDSNYKKVLKELEEEGMISAEKPGKTRRKGTFADDVMITFPARGA